MFTSNNLVQSARRIAQHRGEEGFPGCPRKINRGVAAVLQDCVDGVTHGAISPHDWAAIVDAQAADKLLEQAMAHECRRHTFQSHEYRRSAERKLSEALAWLL